MSSSATASSLPLLSAVMLTNDRVDRCLDCARHAAESLRGIPSSILIINNGRNHVPLPPSIDGVPCRVISPGRNLGAAARNIALTETRSEFLVMLDDDAYIDRTSVAAMLHTLRSDPAIGAVGFRVQGNDAEESCLLPTVFHGCACGFRSSALRRIGGYPTGFLYYGEEYSVAFRLYQAGYRIVVLDGPRRVYHARDSGGRSKDRIIELLVVNNSRLWIESMPWQLVPAAVADTLNRYALVAAKEGALRGYRAGRRRLPAALLRGLLRRHPIQHDILARITLLDQLTAACRRMPMHNAGPLVICGVGKFPSLWLDVLHAHTMRVAAFVDTNPCWHGARIRGIPVLTAETLDPTTIQRVSRDSGAPTFVTGLSSLSDNTLWRNLLRDAGSEELEPPAKVAEYSATGIFDLLADARVTCLSPVPADFRKCDPHNDTKAFQAVPRPDTRRIPLRGTATAQLPVRQESATTREHEEAA